MRDLIEIIVESHSGYKANEYPKRFYWDNIPFEIEEIIDRWYQRGMDPEMPDANYFKVRTTDKKIYILRHETEQDNWYLWIRGESINL